MIAPVPAVISSVHRLAEEACLAEGCTLAWLLSRRRRRGWHEGVVVSEVRQRVIYRMRHAGGIVPSFPEIARAIGAPNHSSIITAYRRECRRQLAHEEATCSA